ncbi:TetR/AcrR family transcriptional regulator [Cellulomonas alba]|uniref:TetR/AcrR family transcriptional regulator n=1 Tax=Cellulomonas alba TaxID=3053467 RepID=A0ABT7SGT4_9CELL|nr:TetR/AcrR family transcriptional regulator [Cellulomonas alba]MDM7855395.1 TetR/AcrR family transcriptional regulator [Cellulomonas alba]
MNRLPVAERREQLIEAALTVASRDGIEAATVRAVAAEAGVSLGVVHYCFQDKDELLRAMAHAITQQNLTSTLGALPEGAPVEAVVEGVIHALWHGLRDNRGAQLLSYELTTTALRHPELAQVAIEQYEGQWAAAEQALQLVEHASGITWAVPRAALARTVIAVVDGISLAWLVDGDDASALSALQGFGRYLASVAVPGEVVEEPVGADVPA